MVDEIVLRNGRGDVGKDAVGFEDLEDVVAHVKNAGSGRHHERNAGPYPFTRAFVHHHGIVLEAKVLESDAVVVADVEQQEGQPEAIDHFIVSDQGTLHREPKAAVAEAHKNKGKMVFPIGGA